ncbi:MAG TPA: MoaD/ThiS family protein [Euzebyales bacterium]|nr:MoaD/ThiS family protein [Euzebyales bacterium]
MAVTVRFFAALRDAAGTSQVEVDPGTLPQIVAALCERYGEPFARRVTVASGLLDGQPVRLEEEHVVADGADLALLPPFSGGSAVRSRERRVELVLLAGSLLVPALLGLGAYSDRWAFGLVVVVVGLGSLVDLHVTLADVGLRTVLPTAVALAIGPALLLMFLPSVASAWLPGLIALVVMSTFLLALASPRRHDAAWVVGSTLLAGLLVGLGTAALLLLYDAVTAVQLAGALTLIALADTAANLVARRSSGSPSRARVIVPAAVAAVAAVVVWVLAGRPTPIVPVGLALAATVAAVASVRLRAVLQRPNATPTRRPALLIGTADAVLIGTPLALAWLELLPS